MKQEIESSKRVLAEDSFSIFTLILYFLLSNVSRTNRFHLLEPPKVYSKKSGCTDRSERKMQTNLSRRMWLIACGG